MRIVFACLVACALGVIAAPAHAAPDVLSGAWSGGGTVNLKQGGAEKLRCRISYEKSTGRTFLMHASCAHSSGTFKQTGRVVQISGSRFTGSLYSDQYSVSGDVAINVSGNSQRISVKSSKGSGSLSLSKN